MFESLFNNIEPKLTSRDFTSLVLVPDEEQFNAKFASATSSGNLPLIFKYTLSICPTIGLISDSHAYLNNDDMVTRLRIIFYDLYLNIPIPYSQKIFKIIPYFLKNILVLFHIDTAIIPITIVLQE